VFFYSMEEVRRRESLENRKKINLREKINATPKDDSNDISSMSDFKFY